MGLHQIDSMSAMELSGYRIVSLLCLFGFHPILSIDQVWPQAWIESLAELLAVTRG